MVNSLVKIALAAFLPETDPRENEMPPFSYGGYRRNLSPQPVKIDLHYKSRLRRKIILTCLLILFVAAVLFVVIKYLI